MTSCLFCAKFRHLPPVIPDSFWVWVPQVKWPAASSLVLLWCLFMTSCGDFVVSGLSSSKVSACSMLIKESAEARLGGMIEQSLLKQISSLHLNQGGRSLVFCPMLCPLLYQKSSRILNLRKSITTPPSLPMLAFLESFLQYTPTSANWSLW